MVKLYETGAYLLNGSELVPDDGQAQASSPFSSNTV